MKHHFVTNQGSDFLTDLLTHEDADRLAGEDGDYHQRDLYQPIQAVITRSGP